MVYLTLEQSVGNILNYTLDLNFNCSISNNLSLMIEILRHKEVRAKSNLVLPPNQGQVRIHIRSSNITWFPH